MPEKPMEGDQGNMMDEVMKIMQPCLDKIAAGDYKSKDEAIDALVADLQAAKSEPDLKGLDEGESMKLPEETPEENQ
jgi:hypothetical protein